MHSRRRVHTESEDIGSAERTVIQTSNVREHSTGNIDSFDGQYPTRVISVAEWIFFAVLTTLTVLFFIGSFSYTDAAQRWPLILSVILFTLLAAYAIVAVVRSTAARKTGTHDGRNETNESVAEIVLPTSVPPVGNSGVEMRSESDGETGEDHDTRAALLAAISFLGFAFAAYALGFLLAGVIFLVGYMLLTGQRRPRVVIGVTLGMTVCIYLLFQSTLNAPLNEGAWFWFSLDWLPI